MKFIFGMYGMMALMLFVVLTSEGIFNGEYSAIASSCSLVVFLFLLGTAFFINVKFYFAKK